jgi:hypothetical protein
MRPRRYWIFFRPCRMTLAVAAEPAWLHIAGTGVPAASSNLMKECRGGGAGPICLAAVVLPELWCCQS